MKKGIALFIAGFIALTGIAQAETLALWDGWENNMAGLASTNASTLFTGVNSGLLDRVNTPVHNGDTYNDVFGSSDQEIGLAAALATPEYFRIVVDVTEGQIMNLTSLDLLLQSTVLADGAEKEQRITVFSSVGGWASGDELATYSFLNGATENQSVSLDLTGGNYNGLTSIEFRVVGYRVNDSSNMWNAYAIGNLYGTAANQNIVLSGTVGSAGQRGTLFVVK